MKPLLTVAVAGKGGTGKTTVAGLLIQLLGERVDGSVLAVDADPNANLGDLLGLIVPKTIGELREEVLARLADLPPGVAKDRYLEYGLHQCLVEGDRVDLLVMGRGEGPKCYCMINHILRRYMEVLRGSYRYVVIDNEAGMEHLSRRTTQDVDALLIVAHGDPISVRSAGRIGELAQELGLNITERYLLLNDLPGGSPSRMREEAARIGIPLIGEVPHDREVAELALAGKPLTALSPRSPAKEALARVLARLLLQGKEDRGGHP